ncbi:MAG: hypothetical protein ABIQ97_07250 [Lysobacteraceae bacterium]
MSIKQKLAIVAAAESDCALRLATVHAGWRGLKSKTKIAATPPRIVVSGLALGFLGGLGTSGGSNSDSSLIGKLFAGLAHSGVTSAVAAVSAGMAAASVKDSPPQAPPAPPRSSSTPLPPSATVRVTTVDTVP